jgi:hypothetical protein
VALPVAGINPIVDVRTRISRGLAVHLKRKPIWPVALMLFLAGLAQAVEPPSTEYSVKAAFLYRFADYIEWPPTAFASPTSPVTVCVIGRDPFGPILDMLTDGERVADRSIAVKRAQKLDDSMGCHVAYVDTKGDPTSLLQAVEGRPVLTVTNGIDETGAHGIINFVIHDNRVRFDIDVRLAAANGLSISSRLLSVALAVNGPSGSRENPP